MTAEDAASGSGLTGDASGRRGVIAALGVVQILAWGSSYYLLSVLAAPIAAETGWPLAWIIGGLSCGLLAAGIASPRVGLMIARHGGRPVLAGSAVLLATGLTILGLSQSLPVFLAGWLALGLGMGAGLYDPAFATLGRLYGAQARSAITVLTLWGGFASTVSWPFSAFLVDHFGWRWTCFSYAALQIAVSLPLILAVLPKASTAMPGHAEPKAGPPPRPALLPGERRAFFVLAGLLTLAGTATTLVSVHLITLLQDRGVALGAAVALGALIGPAQVGARLVEMTGRGRHHPLWTLTAAVGLVLAGIVLLAAGPAMAALALLLYGAGNGVYSIARGTVPLALFGPERYPALAGRLARPALLAQAAAPIWGAILLSWGGADAVFALLLALAGLNVGLLAALWGAR